MNKLVCNYALVRFLPYRETGEFVNVGVVLYCPEIDLFDFRLAENRNRRVRGFFPELDRSVYRAAIESMEKELNRHRNNRQLLTEGRKVADQDLSRGLTEFRSLLRRRETLVHFADPGMIVEHPTDAIGLLYGRYINRNFAQPKEYQERKMRQRLDHWLREWNLREQYKVNQKLGDDTFHLRLPFVHFKQDVPIKAIKPLDLDKPETTEIYEHGDAWVQRIRRLKGVGHLPEQMIFTIRWPIAAKQMLAADEICEALRKENAVVLTFDQPEQLREAARI